jgi:hypothetical protein
MNGAGTHRTSWPRSVPKCHLLLRKEITTLMTDYGLDCLSSNSEEAEVFIYKIWQFSSTLYVVCRWYIQITFGVKAAGCWSWSLAYIRVQCQTFLEEFVLTHLYNFLVWYLSTGSSVTQSIQSAWRAVRLKDSKFCTNRNWYFLP